MYPSPCATFSIVSGCRPEQKMANQPSYKPYQSSEFFEDGMSARPLIDGTVSRGSIERLGQGRENSKQFLRDNPQVARAIEEKVRKELGLLREPEVAAV